MYSYVDSYILSPQCQNNKRRNTNLVEKNNVITKMLYSLNEMGLKVYKLRLN